MKKSILSLSLVFALSLVNAQTKFPNKEITQQQKTEVKSNAKVDVTIQKEKSNSTIDFVSKVVDYGIIEHNADGARKFVFLSLIHISEPTRPY